MDKPMPMTKVEVGSWPSVVTTLCFHKFQKICFARECHRRHLSMKGGTQKLVSCYHKSLNDGGSYVEK